MTTDAAPRASARKKGRYYREEVAYCRSRSQEAHLYSPDPEGLDVIAASTTAVDSICSLMGAHRELLPADTQRTYYYIVRTVQ